MTSDEKDPEVEKPIPDARPPHAGHMTVRLFLVVATEREKWTGQHWGYYFFTRTAAERYVENLIPGKVAIVETHVRIPTAPGTH